MDQERHRRRVEFMKKQVEEDRKRDSDALRLNPDTIISVTVADDNSVQSVSKNSQDWN